MFYTGIGSRNTPPETLDIMRQLARQLATRGHVLRSGKAGGADTAFQLGMQDSANGTAEIFIPWPRFGASPSLANSWDISAIPADAMAMAADIHPAWHRCSQGARKMHARNMCQVLGPDLHSPSGFLIFWAPETKAGVVSGGTASAVGLARRNNIPTINLASLDWLEQLQALQLP